MKRYKIVRIDEADYGCEGRPDGEEAMDSVWLEDENGERQIVRVSVFCQALFPKKSVRIPCF